MTKITHIPAIVLTHGITALLLLVASLFITGSIDIAIHDTYFVISYDHVLILITLFYVFFALIVWGMHKIARRLSPLLNWLHYLITSVCLMFIFVLMNSAAIQPGTYSDYNVFNETQALESTMDLNVWLTLIGLLLIIGQLLFITNVIRAFILKKKR